MDLLKAILKEHSKEQTARIVKYVGDDKNKFAELMKLFLKGEYRVTQRAGWPLSYCVEIHPELITPYYKQILDYLEKSAKAIPDKPVVHEAVVRNIVRLLQHVEIPKRYHGRVMDSCFKFISDHNTAVAIKASSLTVLENLADAYPEIKPELKLVIEERWPHETAAFRSRAKKILRKM
jgi:hypothetical protein